jgi:oligopeptide transport system substrate-binding protein
MKWNNNSIIVVTSLIFLLLAACSNNSDNSEELTSSGNTEDQVLNLFNGDTIPTMDVSMATDEYAFQFLSMTTEGLYRLGNNGEIMEGIAINHDVSDDGLVWTFHLREEAVWSNGDPVTAHDFVYSWRRSVDPATGSEYGPYLMSGVIKNATEISEGKMKKEELGVVALNDYTLQVTLEKPTPYFESLTTFGTFYPLNEKFVEEKGEKYATSSDTLLANGPFILKDWETTSQSWYVEKNPNYWDAETVKLEKITYNVSKDPQTMVSLYESGKVHQTTLTSDLVDLYSTRDDFTIETVPVLTFMKFNQEHEVLKNVNIRRAISRAIDKDALVNEILNNGSISANGAVPRNFAIDPETKKDFREVAGEVISYDKEKALEYWKTGLAELGIKNVKLELVSSDSELSKIVNEYLANQLQSNLPGLTISIRSVPFEQQLALDAKMDYDIIMSSWSADYLDPYGWLNLWLSNGPNNNTGYANPEYDKLVESTVYELASKEKDRFQAFIKAEKVLLDDAVISPLYQQGNAMLTSPNLKGVISNPFGAEYEYKWAYLE